MARTLRMIGDGPDQPGTGRRRDRIGAKIEHLVTGYVRVAFRSSREAEVGMIRHDRDGAPRHSDHRSLLPVDLRLPYPGGRCHDSAKSWETAHKTLNP